jgi:GNAT superfamily N-acetyltransferase
MPVRAARSLKEARASEADLTHRAFTREEAQLLHEELKTTPNILGYTTAELLRFSDVFVAQVSGTFAGACISKDLRFGWTDIAVLYVLPAFRGQGLGTQLYAAAWQRARQRGRHIFTLSRSTEVIHLMEQFGMEISRSVWRAPLAVHLHMNRHMMSWYRLQEARRKSRQIQDQGPLCFGVRRSQPPPVRRAGR